MTKKNPLPSSPKNTPQTDSWDQSEDGSSIVSLDKVKALVVVEAPGKVKKIQGYLGSDYIVKASVGHIMDLPKKGLGVVIENKYAPTYTIMEGKEKVVAELRDIANKVPLVILCSVVYDEPILIRDRTKRIDFVKIGKFIDQCYAGTINPLDYEVAAHNRKTGSIEFRTIKKAIRHISPEKLITLKTDYNRSITITESHSVFSDLDQVEKGNDCIVGKTLLVPNKLPTNKSPYSTQIDILQWIIKKQDPYMNQECFISRKQCEQWAQQRAFKIRVGEGIKFDSIVKLTDEARFNLIDLRIETKLSQSVLAKQIGLTQSQICCWEKGKSNPTMGNLKRYLNLLGGGLELLGEGNYEICPSIVQQRVEKALTTQCNHSNKSLLRDYIPIKDLQEIDLPLLSNVQDIYSHNGKLISKRFIPVDEELGLILGYFSAEGSIIQTQNRVIWSFGPQNHADENTHIYKTIEWIKKYFPFTHKDSRPYLQSGQSSKISICNSVAKFLFESILDTGYDSYSKKISWLIFSSQQPIQIAFLQGSFLGDGSLQKSVGVFNTVSLELAQGIRYLLLQNGLHSGFSITPPSPSPDKIQNEWEIYRTVNCYGVTIHSLQNNTVAKQITENHYLYSSSDAIPNPNTARKYLDVIQDTAKLKIKDRIEQINTDKFVYDLEVEGHTFICGDGAICAHNSDPDREGEYIGYSIAMLLRREGLGFQRISYQAITKQAIQKALANPRNLDKNLVRAQQARRILDRLVGFKVSPLLWNSIQKGLSAGRVQSVGLRLIVDRQDEVDQFVPQNYWTVKTDFVTSVGNFEATIETKFSTELEAKKIVTQLKAGQFKIKTIDRKQVPRSPAPPFTTSQLVQQASTILGWDAKRTNSTAQRLYELAYTTYIRSDSVTIDPSVIPIMRTQLQLSGPKYVPTTPHVYKNNDNAQEAHEAIRPLDFSIVSLTGQVPPDEAKLYDLIYARAIASQAAPALFDRVTITLENSGIELSAKGQTLNFDGYLKFWPHSDNKEVTLPNLTTGQVLSNATPSSVRHTTKAPSKYNTASLVKELEESGVGRPSTYQSIIDTLVNRKYITLEGKAFIPTDIGRKVCGVLKQYIPKVVDIQFTAEMESKLDLVAQGKMDWISVIDYFWKQFDLEIKKAHLALPNISSPIRLG